MPLTLRRSLLLQGLSMDVRPEVRNSAVRTLFAVVAGQGSRMSSAAWEECLWQMLFPLLRFVHHLAATSSKEEVHDAGWISRPSSWLSQPASAIMRTTYTEVSTPL